MLALTLASGEPIVINVKHIIAAICGENAVVQIMVTTGVVYTIRESWEYVGARPEWGALYGERPMVPPDAGGGGTPEGGTVQ